jgi:cardiolipin synthase (CMP-forming)
LKIPDFILNIPNVLSLARIVFVPLFIYLLMSPSQEAKIWALVVFAVVSITDLLDGWSARKLNQETEFGKFIDPLADKLLVISTLIAFLILDKFIPLWMVIIIVGRDIMITVMRSMALKKGTSLRTSNFGKVKTAFQMGSIVIIIMLYIFVKKHGKEFEMTGINFFSITDVLELLKSNEPNKWLIVAPYWIMLSVTILTAFSGVRYLMTNLNLFWPTKSDNSENKENNE